MRKVTSKLEIPCGCQINLNYKYISSDMLTNNTNIISNRVFSNRYCSFKNDRVFITTIAK